MPAAPKAAADAAAASTSSNQAAPKKRSRTGCLVCRKRKHKCDSERHATADGTYSCARCLKTGKTCLWPVVQPLEARFAPYPATAPAVGPTIAPGVASGSGRGASSLTSPGTDSSGSTSAAPPGQARGSSPSPPSVSAAHSFMPVETPWTSNQPPTADWLNHLLPRSPVGSSGTYLQTFGPPPPPAPTPAPSSHALAPAASPLPFFWPSPLPAAAFESNPALDLGSWAGSPWASQSNKAPAETEAGPKSEGSSASSGNGTLPFELMELIGSQVQPDRAHALSSDGRDWLTAIPAPMYLEPTPTLVQLWPDPEERNLMTHFLKMVPTVCTQPPRMTFSLQHGERPLDSVGQSVQAFFPFLDIPAFLSTPRRTSTASEALSFACMSVGAIHLQYLHQQSAVAAQAQPGGDALALVSLAAHDKYGRLASSLNDSSLALGQTSLLLSQLSSTAADGSGVPSVASRREDLSHLLAACSASVLSRCLSGSSGHGPMLDLANEVVRALGGPKAMLEAEVAGRSLLFPEATRRTSTGKRLRIVRSLLEDLAAWDICLSLTTNRETLGCRVNSVATDEGLSDWLFRYAPPPGPVGDPGGAPPEGKEDWDTLAYTMCVSRPIFDLCCRVNQLHGHHLKAQLAADSDAPETSASPSIQRQAEDLLLEIRLRSRDFLRSHPDLSFERTGVEKTEVSTLTFSSLEWTLALEIFVLFELLGEPKSTLKMQTLAFHVVNIFDERMQRGQNEFGSDWPLVIAGTMLEGEQERAAVKRIVLSSAFPFAFDMNQKFCELMTEVWAAHDAGNTTASWRMSKVANSGLLLF